MLHSSSDVLQRMSRTQQESILEERPDVAKEWDIEYGDRHTQFVIIGTDIEKEEIVKSLDQCLLDSREIDADWSQFSDPYHWTITQQ